MSITNIPFETISDSLYIEGINGKNVHHKSVPVPLTLADSDNVYWTEFWVGKNTVGTIIGVDILKDLQADVLLSKDNETMQ